MRPLVCLGCLASAAALALPLALVAAACSSSTDTGTVALVAGEPDVFTATPPVVSLSVTLASDDDAGTTTELGTATLPATTVGLTDIPTSASGAVVVTGNDATGTAQVRGTTLPINLGALGGETLDVYVQRIGEMSRLPNPLATVHTAPNVLVTQDRFVAAVDPTTAGASVDLYDMLEFAPSTPITLTRAAQSMVAPGTLIVAIDPTGATYVDLTDLTTGELSAPSGGSFADVAGGQTVVSPAGTSFVVGATRASGDPTVQVLVVASDGTTSFAQLTVPRLGASAAYVTGRGLVVFGGSATGVGAEVIADGASTAAPLPFPVDATTGSGATALDTATVLVAGGTTPAADGSDAGAAASATRVFNLACATDCVTAWPALPEPLTTAAAFALDASSALVVGDDAQTTTHAIVVNVTSATELTLREPRQGARAVVLPTQGIALVGGTADLESYLPH